MLRYNDNFVCEDVPQDASQEYALPFDGSWTSGSPGGGDCHAAEIFARLVYNPPRLYATYCKMQRLIQPTANTCGQTCVAMISSQTVDDVCKVMGRKGGTHTRDLIKALSFYGFACGDRLIRMNQHTVLPALAIVKVKHPTEKWTHWAVWRGNKFLDPFFDGSRGAIAHGWRTLSYLEVGDRCN